MHRYNINILVPNIIIVYKGDLMGKNEFNPQKNKLDTIITIHINTYIVKYAY